MNFDGLNSEGDLPANHPLVLEALKGIISGPISEFRSTVDNLITNPSNALKRSGIDYNNLLPSGNGAQAQSTDRNLQVANDILNQAAIIQTRTTPQPLLQTFTEQSPLIESDPNQLELPLFKPTEISDLYKKMFDIEGKIDTLIGYVKNSQNKK